MISSPDIIQKPYSTFVNQFNPRTGTMQWAIVSENYDYLQEIAQSAYADMLHDSDRNLRYHEALRHVIKGLKTSGREAHVLDIGTGTGLLSMMAVEAGADSVVACEAFDPVAKCAEKILKANGFSDKVKIIHKRSTDLVVGKDMPRRANVLVAELFDTELIGEGALEVYKHAADHLLTPDAMLIPCKARMYLQILESPFLWSHHAIEPFADTEIGFPTKKMLMCHGSPAVFDIQASMLKFTEHDESIIRDEGRGAARCLLENPLMFHEFNFTPPSSNIYLASKKRISEIDGKYIEAYKSGTAHAVLVWWELQMEPTNQVPPITIAPKNVGTGGDTSDRRATPVWREHWMQAVYFPRSCPLTLSGGQPICVDFAHDKFSMYFDLHPASDLSSLSPVIDQRSALYCNCLAHVAWNRSRLAQLNHPEFRRQSFELVKQVAEAVSRASKSSSVALVVVSDATLLPLQLSRTLPIQNTKIFHLDSSQMAKRLMESIYRESGANVIFEECIDSLINSLETFYTATTGPVEIYILSEPYGVEALLPWNPIQFWYVYGQIASILPAQLLSPTALRVQAVAMDFDHLWKVRAPVGNNVEGFDLRLFDKMILSAAEATDASVEPYPLWQYTGKARSLPVCVFELSLIDPPSVSSKGPRSPQSLAESKTSTQTIPLSEPSTVKAVAMWAEWRTLDGCWYAVGGPLKLHEIGQEVNWCKVGPQTGVYFLPCGLKSELSKRGGQACALKVECDFDFLSGEPNFRFSVV